MIIQKRRLTEGYTKPTYEFLIRCDVCGKEEWLPGNRCKYGKRKFCSRKCINKGRVKSECVKKQLSDQNSGKGNPFYGREHTNESRHKMSQRQKEIGGLKHIKQQNLTPKEFKQYWEGYRLKFMGQNNHFFGKTHSAETRKHLSEVKAELISTGMIDLKPSHYGLKGYYKSSKLGERFRFDSFIEMLRMIILDNDDSVLWWTKRHGIRIQYQLNSTTKHYIPDFLIRYLHGDVIEEVKGYENNTKKEAKFSALKLYCSENGFGCSIVTYSDMKEITKTYFGKSIDVLRSEYKEGVFCAQD
jgi:hypothetical protein